MYMLSTFSGVARNFAVLSEYKQADKALKEIKSSVRTSYEDFHSILHNFLEENNNIILYQDASFYRVDEKKTSMFTDSYDILSVLEKVKEKTSQSDGYWILMAVFVNPPNLCRAYVAPLDAMCEHDYALTRKVLRHHNISNILKEL